MADLNTQLTVDTGYQYYEAVAAVEDGCRYGCTDWRAENAAALASAGDEATARCLHRGQAALDAFERFPRVNSVLITGGAPGDGTFGGQFAEVDCEETCAARAAVVLSVARVRL